INSDAENVPFTLPTSAKGLHWDVVINTHEPEIIEGENPIPNGSVFDLPGRSLVLLRRHDVDEDD
ncbi:MAG: hypothetical protein H0V47_06595, partial [Chloroflexia bacterium]|nr:hypothetical protein [Chloroflexia bacterium]